MYLELVGMFTMFIICINQQSKSTMTLVFMAFPLGYEPFFWQSNRISIDIEMLWISELIYDENRH